MQPFLIDRDRVLSSFEFRRLADVTQVTSASEGVHYRNRLSHTLHVARTARHLADRLARQQPTLVQEAGSIDPDVAETAALAHDLGHPPFGHIGEYELDHLLRQLGDADGYEGNAQTFRILTKLVPRSAHNRSGLNLTRATLNAVLKYPWLRQTSGLAARKFGAYSMERSEFDFARAASTPERRSLEADVMDWSDDIAYIVDDFEDFIQARLIPLERLRHYSADFLPAAQKRVSASVAEITEEVVADSFNRVLKNHDFATPSSVG